MSEIEPCLLGYIEHNMPTMVSRLLIPEERAHLLHSLAEAFGDFDLASYPLRKFIPDGCGAVSPI